MQGLLSHLGSARRTGLGCNYSASSLSADTKAVDTERGQTEAEMNNYIKYTAGTWGVISTAIVFVMAVIGAYLGYLILREHFKEA